MFARPTFGNPFQPFSAGYAPAIGQYGHPSTANLVNPLLAAQLASVNPLLQQQIGTYGVNPLAAAAIIGANPLLAAQLTTGLPLTINPLLASQLAVNPYIQPNLVPQIWNGGFGMQPQSGTFGMQPQFGPINPLIGQMQQTIGSEAGHFGYIPFGFQQPGFQQPGFQQPGFQQPGFQQSGFQQSGVQQPGVQQPGFQQSGVQQPGFQQPGVQQPGFQQSGFQQPGFQQSGFQQSGFQQPGFQQGWQGLGNVGQWATPFNTSVVTPYGQFVPGIIPQQAYGSNLTSAYLAQDPTISASLLQQRMPIRSLVNPQQTDPLQSGISGLSGMVGNTLTDPYLALSQAYLAQCGISPQQQMARGYTSNWTGSPYSIGQVSPLG